MEKKHVGKGLKALIPEEESETDSNGSKKGENDNRVTDESSPIERGADIPKTGQGDSKLDPKDTGLRESEIQLKEKLQLERTIREKAIKTMEKLVNKHKIEDK